MVVDLSTSFHFRRRNGAVVIAMPLPTSQEDEQRNQTLAPEAFTLPNAILVAGAGSCTQALSSTGRDTHKAPSCAGLLLKWNRRRHPFQQIQDLLGGPGQTKLLTEKDRTIKTGLCIEGVLAIIPSNLLWRAS